MITKEEFVKYIEHMKECDALEPEDSETHSRYVSKTSGMIEELLEDEFNLPHYEDPFGATTDLSLWCWGYDYGRDTKAKEWEDETGKIWDLSSAERMYDYMTRRKWDPYNNRPRVLIDMDDCINDFTNFLCEKHNERTGDNLDPSTFTTWELNSYIPEYKEIMNEEGFFFSVPEKKDAVKTLNDLITSTKYDVYIITACGTNKELEEKFKWFDKYLPRFNKDRIIKCKEKNVIRGDVLIDDKVDNLDKCSPYMRCVLFDMPSNREANYPRVSALKDVVPMLEEWFYN